MQIGTIEKSPVQEQDDGCVMPREDEFLTKNYYLLAAKYVFPYIMTGILYTVVAAFSLYTQARHFHAELVMLSVQFYAAADLFGTLLPGAWGYIAASTLQALMLDYNFERRKVALAAYFTVLSCVGVVLGIIFAAVGKLVANFFKIPKEFQVSFVVNLAFYPIVSFFGQAQSMRYLSEQRLIVLMSSHIFYLLLGLALEYFCYSFLLDQYSNTGNLPSTLCFLFVGVVFAALNTLLVFGFSMYGFVVKNVSVLKIKDLLNQPKEQIKIIFSQLWQCLPKFIIDCTLPLSVCMSTIYIDKSFYDANLMFYACADLYVFYFYMSAIKACSSAFGKTFFVVYKLACKRNYFKYGMKILIRFLVFSMLCTGVLLLVVYFCRRYLLLFLLPTTIDDYIAEYVSERQGRLVFSLLAAGLINLLDIIPYVVIGYLLVHNNAVLIYVLAIIKLSISIVMIYKIAVKIGDKANYMYILIFGEGANIAICTCLLLYAALEYLLLFRKKDQSSNLGAREESSRRSRKSSLM